MGKKPIVSVIIPTYNRDILINRAIKSVLNQTYQDFELIIVDDGSTDETEKVINEFMGKDDRIIFLKHEENKGGSAARNTGIRASKGEYIAFLDSDDEWLSEKLEKQVEFFKKNCLNIGLVYTGFFKIYENPNKDSLKIIPKKSGWIFEDLLLEYCIGPTSSVMVRKECLDDVGLFDKELPSCQDWDMWIRFSKKFQFNFLDKPLTRYYVNKNSISANKEAKIEGRKKIIKNFQEDLRIRKRVLAQHYFEIANLYCHFSDINEGKKYFLKAIFTYPFDIKFFIYFFSSLFNKKIYLSLAKIKRTLR